MFEFVPPGVWIAVAGGFGGLFNGIASHNRFLWPRRLVSYPPIRLVRPGLAANILVGAVFAAGVFQAFAHGVHGGWSSGRLMFALAAALICGALASRCTSGESDKRLLRAALIKACAAPAAHPDVCGLLASAPAHAVLEIADDLAPRFRGLP
jgi:hypothetical protein